MKTTTSYPQLARFLADHFGGYEDAKAAAEIECGGNVDDYLEEYLQPMKGEGLDTEEAVQFYEHVCAAEKFLVEKPDFDAVREKYFDDAGTPRLSLAELEEWNHQPGVKFLCELVWQWN